MARRLSPARSATRSALFAVHGAHRAILSAAEVAALLETLYATGLPRGELAGLAVYDVDGSVGTVMIRDGKGGRDRQVPINARACAWIERYQVEVRPGLLADPDAPVLFVNEAGGVFNGQQLTHRVKRYLYRAGIDTPGACHLFRHTMATQMLDNGAELRFIQALLGHATIETTTVYTHVSLAKLKAAPSAPGSEMGVWRPPRPFRRAMRRPPAKRRFGRR